VGRAGSWRGIGRCKCRLQGAEVGENMVGRVSGDACLQASGALACNDTTNRQRRRPTQPLAQQQEPALPALRRGGSVPMGGGELAAAAARVYLPRASALRSCHPNGTLTSLQGVGRRASSLRQSELSTSHPPPAVGPATRTCHH